MKKYSQILKSKKYKRGKDLCGYKPIYIIKNIKTIKARSWNEDDIKLDPKGYFLIRIHKNRIQVGLIKRKMISRLDHAYYMGIKLERAEYCLKNKKNFIQ